MKDELAARLEAMRRQIGARWVVGFENFDGGHPFIEVAEGPVYRLTAYERGKRLFTKETTELDEILYWAMYEVTWNMAYGYAVEHPVEGEEQRFTAFRRQEELLGTLNPAWVERARATRPTH
ncbi:immunity protein 63 of polymorphic toxin system [Lentzea atacamensis]|uniref:Immunity protein 63 of polymorphic toxin system n=2 Tax=Lentzea TaxID=165301 RepID=A0A316I0C4_9PSEU|nr:Imm63 family immunity protein [Lentzea atacamensis]PWK86137.1 immunity protein 63 of polymorphic toxin system [Lentzea atacamensis]